ncbi:diguanylate cyclase (GGDEF)-like protein [Saccharopolyspora erythraea NRRL 2338]|uniref:Diguanylate cyclase/phosphodiesterase n=2 Tax=Saccharopolyspora erythraea TaxID=1836 RepID=A4FEQ9_SACEN|nr:GGDEF domain-containing protein [Saccharopolyspora erythraea]EQD83203.1 diguanylate cyclase [Saccharopolyspora erythraea D]PFG96258.1 diguanylate cyclase (GGDEF)-like protein [Saccharopolyspora erythraea NRRL 2338]QRK92779.1 GGDEF domain-containing protein [Saccharopolyspora erythraea]CAM02534.1 diguanylate cyclase/phosphodiesterase [Saccharopolyspora erythraea NRRL 2338]
MVGKGLFARAPGNRSFRRIAAAAIALLLVEITVAGSGVLGWSGSIALNKVWEIAASVAALGAWTWSAVRHQGPQRRWRQWMSAAMACFLVGLVAWSWGQVVVAAPLPTATLGPAGFLLTPVIALLALVIHAYERGPGPRSPLGDPRNLAIKALDLLIIAGSVVLFVSVTLGTHLSQGWDSSGPILTMLAAHPMAYLWLAAGTVALARLRRGARELPVLFIALAAVSYMVSSALFGHYVETGAETIPPWLEAGFMACPVFFFLGALAPSTGRREQEGRAHRTVREVVQLAVPYLPLIATALFIAAGLLAGLTLTRFQECVFVALMGLVISRQLATLLENNRLLRRAEYEALHDPLTGVANRTLFLHWLERSLADCRRPIVLAFCDLDDFKEVNDNFGHAAGDLVLTSAARRLTRCAGADDLVARLGGDEFAVVLHNVHEPLEEAGQRLLRALQEPHDLNGRPLVVSASVGMTYLSPDQPVAGTDTLMRWADSAMYVAKRRGKNTLAHTLEFREEHIR